MPRPKKTDDTGEYRFASLSAGRYFLAVSAAPWYTSLNATVGEDAPRNITHAGYAVRYFPNANEAAAAEPLALKAGQQTVANFTLLPIPAASVDVHCDGPENLTISYTLMAAGLAGTNVTLRQGSSSGDSYNLWGVPPGHYTLRAEARDGNQQWYGLTDFDLADDSEVAIVLHTAPTLTGTIVANDGNALPASLTIVLHDSGEHTYSASAGPDGRFALPAIPPGSYQLEIGGAADYFLKKWGAENARRDGERLIVEPGAAVRLKAIAAKGERILGKVVQKGHPLPGALVVLAPLNCAAPTNSDGSFEFRGVPPGNYQIFAVASGQDLEYANPEAIRSYLPAARKISFPLADPLALEVMPLK